MHKNRLRTVWTYTVGIWRDDLLKLKIKSLNVFVVVTLYTQIYFGCSFIESNNFSSFAKLLQRGWLSFAWSLTNICNIKLSYERNCYLNSLYQAVCSVCCAILYCLQTRQLPKIWWYYTELYFGGNEGSFILG